MPRSQLIDETSKKGPPPMDAMIVIILILPLLLFLWIAVSMLNND